jgi:hypothetical protein
MSTDLSPYTKRQVLGNSKSRKKLKLAIEESILHYELIWAKRHLITHEFPELDIIMKHIEEKRAELEKLWEELRTYD